MKFGKYLASRILELPEYTGHFIDYKALKKLIKHLAIDHTQNSTNQDVQKTLKENKASFFFRVERELEKVNSFYLEKQANLAVTLDLLIMKKDELLTKSNEYLHGSMDSNNANFKNSITYINLYQNFKKGHQDLLRLQQFIELNETGFSKVVKKWDKRSKSHTRELFIQSAVSVQPVFHKNEINELSDLVTHSLFELESIMDGDYSSLTTYHSKSAEPKDTADRRESVDSNSTRNYLQNGEIDELYSSFVNIATTKEPDLTLLARWVGKVRSTKNSLATDGKFKFSKIFTLAVTNLKISDTFLQSFLEMIDYQVDFAYVSDDFNNNKTILHECCSIAETHAHVTFDNGVKVINSNDSINHSRTFIVKHIMENLSNLQTLLTTQDFNGRTCIHYASQNNRIDLLDLILPAFPKASLDALDKDSLSALLLAIKYGHFEVVQKMVQFGTSIFTKSDDSRLQYLPINYACKYGNYQILEYLLSCPKPDNASINRQDVEGLFPLHVISRSGHYELIKLLIQHGAQVNQVDGFNKWTPIFYAALEGHKRTTQELVKHGAKPNIVDEDGYNVLYYCVIEGHIDILNELLSYKVMSKSTLTLLANTNSQIAISPDLRHDDDRAMENDDTSEDSGSIDKNADAIPDLQLPPPILPLRRYGHNYLEQKVLIELIFPDENEFINIFNSSTDLKPGRLTLTSNNSEIVPRNILLPLMDDTTSSNNCVFQTDVESLNEFRIDFEIFPKFGTRLIAKTTALAFSQIDTSSPEINSLQLPIFDLRLKNIGELKLNYQVIFPYAGSLLETSKFDTYWKSSTSFVKSNQTLKLNPAGGLSPNNFLSPSTINGNQSNAPNQLKDNVTSNESISSLIPSSVVTATSLSGEYLRIKICLLSDGTPVVCPHWSISITENIDLYLPNLSLAQLNSITNDLFDYTRVIHDLSNMRIKDIGLIKKLLRIIYLPLEVVLDVLSADINLNLEFVFPSLYELEMLPFIGSIQLNLNRFIDFTLTNVFNHIRNLKLRNSTVGSGRSIIFLSANSLVCKILNWKQPNFPVFLLMNGIAYSSKKHKFEKRSTNGLLIDDINKSKQLGTNGAQNIKSKFVDETGSHHDITTRSIKEAVSFSISNNLIGLITSIHLLDLVPKLIPLIRSRGLVLVASSDFADYETEESIQKELDAYTRTEINGLRFDDVLSFKGDISM